MFEKIKSQKPSKKFYITRELNRLDKIKKDLFIEMKNLTEKSDLKKNKLKKVCKELTEVTFEIQKRIKKLEKYKDDRS